jgi:cytochrome b561
MTQGHDEVTTGAGQAPVYSPMAQRFHWITVAAVFVMVPLGFAMSYRGNTLNIWDGVTDALYSSHKLIGFLLLWLTAGRLIYRLVHGAPPDEPTLEWWQKAGSHLLHWALYGLLLIVPLLGWIGVSLFPSLMVFNLFGLPPLASPDEVAAKRVLAIHGWLAILLALLVCAHIGAALFHHVIRKDGVLRRMLPSVK